MENGTVTLPERAEAARDAGFSGVEIQFPYVLEAAALRTELERLALPLVLINLPAGDLMEGGAGLAAVPEHRPAFARALEQALRYAEVVRPERVNVLPGRLVEGVEREAALACLADNLRLAADAFAGLGIGVCCEAINRFDMPGFLIAGSAELVDLMDRVAHANVAAQLDLYHLVRMGESLPVAIGRMAGRIGHVQFADAPGALEDDQRSVAVAIEFERTTATRPALREETEKRELCRLHTSGKKCRGHCAGSRQDVDLVSLFDNRLNQQLPGIAQTRHTGITA